MSRSGLVADGSSIEGIDGSDGREKLAAGGRRPQVAHGRPRSKEAEGRAEGSSRSVSRSPKVRKKVP